MTKLSTANPFVLLDDGRNEGAAPTRLYTDPIEIITTRDVSVVPALLAKLKSQKAHIAGFIAYEAGHGLESKLASFARSATEDAPPLLWFGIFESYQEIAPDAVATLLPEAEGGWVGAPSPRISRPAYETALTKVKDYIAAGDIYQANLTFACDVAFMGDPLAVYAGLRARAKAGYGGIVWTGEDMLLSLSPELFFALKDGKLTTKPMKGTAMRGADAAADAAAAATLQSDPKQRAENLMIVDLLRNDLSRVSVPGSVAVPQLFHIETYPTIHQMISTVSAQLRDGVDAVDVISTIFPCGSITGAPKIRAMEVIDEVEAAPRGAYTGSIGRIDPGGDAAFNVAIRTLHLRANENRATMGLGSGIIADSESGDEWRECLAKGGFVSSQKTFDLFETMRFDPAVGIQLLDRHIARIGESARMFGFPFDRHAARNELQAATFRISESRRVRLMLSPSGRIAIEIQPHQPVPGDVVDVSIVPLPVESADFRLRHKTTDRSFYVKARASTGSFEVALLDSEGFITEGSFTNIFVRGPGALLTPPLSRGLLPGVLRAELIANGSAVEADLRPIDLAEPFFIGNASRGLIPARLADQG
jgi:para-aminobenzoate synthetase / 4-amino-4-deoxychorismate lyase